MDDATQVSTAEPMFTVQWAGEDVTIPTSLSAMLERHAGDAELCAWMKSAPVDGCRMFGDAQAMCWVRRVS